MQERHRVGESNESFLVNQIRKPRFWEEIWSVYLYASGYCPSFQVWVDEWDEDLAVDEAMPGLQDFFRVFIRRLPRRSKRQSPITLEQRAVKGIFSEKYRVRLGMILWPA